MAHVNTTSPLRAITVRLSSTPPKQLPHIASFLANDIGRCAAELSTPNSQSKNGSESAILVHKLKTQISALLQGKHAEERWSAVVFVKATVEAGGWEVLQGSGPWVRGMLTILGRPDPDATKQLCILTLTRIFSLAQGQQNLTREIVTPSLPAFFDHCLQAITRKAARDDAKQVDAQSPLLDTVLQAFVHILPHHPSACRPFVSQIKTLLASLLAPTPSNLQPKGSTAFRDASVSRSSSRLAQTLHALLPTCAPKNTASEEYSKSVKVLFSHIHRTADHVFRAVIEEPRPKTSTVDPKKYDQVVSDKWDDEFGLLRWRGIYAGAERLIGLMQMLQAYISTSSPMPYNLPVGSIWRCTERLLGVVGPVPATYLEEIGQLAQKPEIDRDEREGLWSMLPLIHVAAIETLDTLMTRLDLISASLHDVVMDQLIWTFKACGDNQHVRRSVYITLGKLINRFGPSTSQETVKSMEPLIRRCCEDILPMSKAEKSLDGPVINGTKKQSTNVSADNADSYLAPSKSLALDQDGPKDFQDAALNLLPQFLSKLPSQHLIPPIRAQIDRTAILTNHKETMLASVLNPPLRRSKGSKVSDKSINLNSTGPSSIMPFIARTHSNTIEVEAFLRPRMPLVPSRNQEYDDLGASDEGDASRMHDSMVLDGERQVAQLHGNVNGQKDQFQALLEQETSKIENEGKGFEPDHLQDQRSAPKFSPAKRLRTNSPSPTGETSSEPPSKRVHTKSPAPQPSSLLPVTIIDDKVIPTASLNPTVEDDDDQSTSPIDNQSTAQNHTTAELSESSEYEGPSALEKGKGRAVASDDEGREGRDDEERALREGSWVGSETPEINTELNPALFESSEEEGEEDVYG